MTFKTIRTAIDHRGIATIILDRPEQLNAFNQTMLREVAAYIRQAGSDPAVRVLVLRATGKHFSAGADMSTPPAGEHDVEHTGFIDLFLALEAFPKPSIAVIQGACVGGAAAVISCCDLVIAAQEAFFSIPEVRIGVAPVGVTPVLVRAMGLRNYRRHALSGARFSASQAHHDGLVDEVHAADKLDAAIDAAAEAFLLGAPGALADLKSHLGRAYPSVIAELQVAREHHASTDTFKTPEALEGVAAFMERRKPTWYPPR